MELIRNLPPKYINDRCVSYGLFWCAGCKSEVEKDLSNGKKAKSCGCNQNVKHRGTKLRLYRIWRAMKTRCLNPKCVRYKDYGGRGITICNEWLEFIPFRDWALNNGYADNLTIDRKDPDGNYEPKNCRWLTREENLKNKRNTVTLEKTNEIKYLDSIGNYTRKELAEKFGINLSTIYRKIK